MIRWYYILFFAISAAAQPTTTGRYKLLHSIELGAKDIETDRLGNLYLVTPTNQLYKYSPEGKLLSTLNYKYVGNISFVDASNPLEIYVFYKELNKIIYLDNNLAYRGESDLSAMNIGQASAIARAYDNGLWVFDLADLQLKHLNKQGQLLHESGNVRQFINKPTQPQYITDNDNRIIVNDSTTGVLVFDVFATHLNTLPLIGVKQVKVIEDEIYYVRGQYIYRYNLKSKQTNQFELPNQDAVNDISIEKSKLYMLRSGRIDVYAY